MELTDNQKLSAELKWLIDTVTLDVVMNIDQIEAYKKLMKVLKRLENDKA